ncbi:MAG: hypothetical protein IT548_16575 [Alphaproteobacteria bacterium]|nr:hypothetical protein [Alphaproteobacteria bacterium]
MKLKLVTLAALIAAGAAMPAYADDKEDARANCVALTMKALEEQQMPPEQKPKIEAAMGQMCTCMTDKIATMGDDGGKVLRVLAKTTPEMAMSSQGDEAKDRQNAISIMVAEYGISEADAGAIYDRIDPQVKAAGQECQAEMMKALQ